MADYLAADVSYTSSAIDAMLKAYPELAEDDELRLDSIDGQTDIKDVVSRLLEAIGEASAHVDGLNTYLERVEQRRDRKKASVAALRSLVLRLMATANRDKLPLPVGTVSVHPGRKSVSITDLEAIPQGYFKIVSTKQADKEAIRKRLEAGEFIPGAALVTGENVLTVRVK
jgi:hypothetical protein